MHTPFEFPHLWGIYVAVRDTREIEIMDQKASLRTRVLLGSMNPQIPIDVRVYNPKRAICQFSDN